MFPNRAAIPLLKEYSEKLQRLQHDALELMPKTIMALDVTDYSKAVRDELAQRLRYIFQPAEELARQVSAVVEQGRRSANGLERVELWLRLAEFEAALAGAKQTLQRITAKK